MLDLSQMERIMEYNPSWYKLETSLPMSPYLDLKWETLAQSLDTKVKIMDIRVIKMLEFPDSIT